VSVEHLELARARRATRAELARYLAPRPVCLCTSSELALGCGCLGLPRGDGHRGRPRGRRKRATPGRALPGAATNRPTF